VEKVSVIIPLYNAENYIAETLLSLYQQSWKHLEIIVINDGSTDHSAEVVEKLDIPNLKLFNRKNTGQSASSNFGISQANGELIKFLDADDILATDCIEKMVIKWRENPNRLVFGEWHYFMKNTSHVNWNYSPIYKDYEHAIDWHVDTLTKAGSMLAGWMWLIPKKILEKAGGWDERLHLMNDFEFSTRLVLQSDGIGFAKGAVHYYRKGLESAMTSKMNKKIALSIFTGVKEAYNHTIVKEDSLRIRRAFANQFQKWIYQFYPSHSNLVREMEDIVESLGGSTLVPPGGKVFIILNKIFKWKIVASMQWFLHQTLWWPVLKWKRREKLKQ